nr:Gag-Pol polyprotein [Tanacetum cinerariifolium]
YLAFGGNTRDLGSFGEVKDKSTDLHQHLSKISPQRLETALQNTRDAVTNPTTTASWIWRRRQNVTDLKKPLKIWRHEIKKTISLTHKVVDIVLIITPSYELGFRRFNCSRKENEKIYNRTKANAVMALQLSWQHHKGRFKVELDSWQGVLLRRTHFLRFKDETPEVLIDFLRLVQRGLQAQVRVVRSDKGSEFLNQTLHAYFAAEGIQHQMSVARTPEQNGVVERRNHTLVEAARTMLSAAKVPLFFWAEVIATSCFTQNRSLVIPRHEKTPYHIINDRKSSVKFFYIFGSICYIVRDGENLDKMKEKGDECIQSRAYRVFNKRTRVIMESIHVNFDELPQMASDQNSSDLAPEYRTVTTSNELDLLFSPMFDELLNGSSTVVSKSSAVSATDAPNQRQQYTTPLYNHTAHAPTCQILTITPTVISSENINQAETYAENDQVANDEFINIFSTPLESDGKMCMFLLTVSRTEPKNIKEAMADSAWIESMQEELHQFDRLEVWELVDRPLCTNVINLKWLWKNKRDEENIVI